MKITKNTSGFSTRELRGLIICAHNEIKRHERRSAPNWRDLRIVVRGRDAGTYVTGCAVLGGYGGVRGGDMWMTLPRQGLTAREVVRLAYHELMHTYGYDHRAYRDLNEAELARLVPADYVLALAGRKREKKDGKVARIARLIERRKRWERTQKRARTALRKIDNSLRYYERTQPALIAAMRGKTTKEKT